tara:strand:- start:910 stop:1821 length:912 start_codon:yes stop_codon:yes gene_type:complete
MIAFPTKQLILEGPDLVGKTTLYDALHKATCFKWNIQDRSTLSMLCYAILYGRDEEEHRRRLSEELNDLNNRMIILIPDIKIIEERYHTRGDEFQDLSSLRELHKIFSTEAKKIQKRPTVMCIRENVSVETIVNYTMEWSYAIESCLPTHVGEVIRDTLHASSEDELTLRASLMMPSALPDNSILDHEYEGEYYKKILKETQTVIDNELAGNNPYNIPQTLGSRRFIYHSDTCISNLHFMPRGDVLTLHAILRSTDVDRNGSIDLEFLEFLTKHVYKLLDLKADKIMINVTLNSAHIRRDLEE